MFRVAALQKPHRIDREARAVSLLEVADPDAGPARHPPCGSKARFKRRHVLRAFLQRVAGRNEPPHLVEAEGAHRLQADVPMPPVRRVERAAEETDARHAARTASMAALLSLFCRARGTD